MPINRSRQPRSFPAIARLDRNFYFVVAGVLDGEQDASISFVGEKSQQFSPVVVLLDEGQSKVSHGAGAAHERDARAANRSNSARSPLYLATLRFLSNPCFRTFPLVSHTCHSHFVWLCLMIVSSYMAAAAGPLGQCSPVLRTSSLYRSIWPASLDQLIEIFSRTWA
jgi:hypothetical protein